jgi:hypothetical protein
MMKRQGVEALDNNLHDISWIVLTCCLGGRLWCLVEISGSYPSCLKMVEGSGSRCLAADVVPLGFHATSKTGAQHEGKE